MFDFKKINLEINMQHALILSQHNFILDALDFSLALKHYNL